MNKSRLTLLGVITLVSFAAHAQTAPQATDLCRHAEVEIERSLKTVAYESMSGFTDTSAPRETNRQLRIVAANTNIQVQLTHMQMLGCPVPKWSMSPDIYGAAPGTCALGRGDKDSCDRGKWQRKQPVAPQ